MASQQLNITITQGSTLRLWVIVEGVDTSDAYLRLQGRRTLASQEVLFELSPENEGTYPGEEPNTFFIEFLPTLTRTLKRNGVFDVFLHLSEEDVYRIFFGEFTLVPEVTR